MFFWQFFHSNYLQSLQILLILIIESKKSHQNQSDNIQFLYKKNDLNLIEKVLFLVKNDKIG